MSLHKLADESVAAIGGIYGDRTKFFREGTESPHLSEVIAETSVELSKPEAPLEIEEGREMLIEEAYGAFSAPARFTESIYCKLLASSAQDSGEQFRTALNFEQDFTARRNENVYSVMARFDQFIRFERQAGIYRADLMTVLERSHTTGTVAYARLAWHLTRCLFPAPARGAAGASGDDGLRRGGGE